ncbi:Hpt domain-containing protein [Vibrio hippocampi]|nr:Hpt domain-containing protein [Vibrio hippocampi]
MNTKTIDSLRNEIGADNLPILLGIFTSELEQYQAALTTETEQASQFQEICHSLKSSAASFGAEDLCQVATEVDDEVKDGAYRHDLARVDAFLLLLQRTLGCYQQVLATLESD